MMKCTFGDLLRSNTEVAQRDEALLRVLCHNICCVIQSMHKLEISPDFGAARAAWSIVGLRSFQPFAVRPHHRSVRASVMPHEPGG